MAIPFTNTAGYVRLGTAETTTEDVYQGTSGVVYVGNSTDTVIVDEWHAVAGVVAAVAGVVIEYADKGEERIERERFPIPPRITSRPRRRTQNRRRRKSTLAGREKHIPP